MKKPLLLAITLCVAIVTICHLQLNAQDLRTFNQNASRSNHTRLSFSFSPLYSTAVNNSSDSLLFRGSGAGFRLGADYFLGNVSIGFSTGFGSSSPDNTTINNFLKRTGVPQDQLVINKASQQNMYLLIGPSVRFGNIVELSAHAKGGMFINNGGLVNIQQRGAQRTAYRNEATDKSIYPGFLTGLNVQYTTKSDAWSFGIGADYMNTKTEVNNYDVRRGGGIEALKLSRNITDIVAGITIKYNLGSSRETGSGMATGKRSRETGSGIATGKRSREAGSGLATGKRVLPTVNKKEIAIEEPGVHRNTSKSCGPVTMKTTHPDGTTEEMTFSCPADAAGYVTNSHGIPQTDPLTAENTNTGYAKRTFAVPHVLEGKGIISGSVTWATSGTTGIITNAVISNSLMDGSTLKSSASNSRTTNQSSFGTLVRLSARETGSGIATGVHGEWWCYL